MTKGAISMVCITNRIKVTSTGSSVCPRSLAKTSSTGIKSIAVQSWRIPVVDLEPEVGGLEELNVIMRKQFPQSGTRSTEFGERDAKLCKITFNAGLLFLSGLSFGCIQINWTNRQFMAVALIDKYSKNAVRMSVWAADYSWDSLMVTGPCGLGPAISKHGGVRQHNFDCNFLLHSEMHSGGRGYRPA
jgi:hypothetical protein